MKALLRRWNARNKHTHDILKEDILIRASILSGRHLS